MKVKLVSYKKYPIICRQNWNYGKEVDGYNVLFEREDKKKYILHFAEAGPNFNGVMLAGKKYLVDGYTQIGFQRATRSRAMLDKMIKMTQKEIGE